MMFEKFFFEWFHGPLHVSDVYRELAYTISVSRGFLETIFWIGFLLS